MASSQPRTGEIEVPGSQGPGPSSAFEQEQQQLLGGQLLGSQLLGSQLLGSQRSQGGAVLMDSHAESRGFGGGGARLRACAGSVAERLMRLNQNVVNITCAAALAAVFAGYCIGISGSAFLYFERTSSIKVLGKEYFLAMLHLSAGLGALVAAWSADVIGRRASLVVTSALGVLGSLIASLVTSSPWLLLSQFVTGLSLGFALAVTPVFVTEVAPASHRGMLLSVLEVGACVGLALAFILSFLCGGNWRRMLGLGGVPAAALGGAAVFLLPESPWWLAMTGQVRDAVQALTQIEEREEQAAASLEEILRAVGQGGDVVPLFMLREETEATGPHSWPNSGPHSGAHHSTHHPPPSVAGAGVGAKGKGGLSVLSGPSVSVLVSRVGKASKPWRELAQPGMPEAVGAMLVLVMGVAFYQQATGMDTTLSFLPEIFAVAGLASTGAELAASLGLALTRAMAALLSGALVDEVGRKPLLLISAAGSALALLVQALVLQLLSLGQTLADDAEETLASFAPRQHAGAAVFSIIATCNFAAFFSLGLGPIVPLLAAESCPLRLRAMAAGMATAVNRLTVAILVFSLVAVADATTIGVPYLLLAAVTFAAVVFYSLSVKELSGRSLDESPSQGISPSRRNEMSDMPAASSGEWAAHVARRSRVSGMEVISPL